MSDSLAIAATTAALAELLQGALAGVPGARITTLSPGDGSLAAAGPLVNLCLLAAEPAPATRPTAHRGVGPPPASLRLTYFISFHGDEARLEPQLLMGAVAGRLHAQPVLTSALIATAIGQVPSLAGCDLASAADPVRLVAVPLGGAERTAGLAAALGAPGLLGLLYEASPVPLGAPGP